MYGERIVWFKRWEETPVEVEKKKFVHVCVGLKKAYAAERVMHSERKALRFQHDL